MADATVAVNPGRVAGEMDLAALLITVTFTATAYTTATGGLPFDLFTVLANAGPYPISYLDIVALKPLGCTSGKFVVDGNSFAVGTATTTTLPCTIRILGTGSGDGLALTEVDNGNLTGSFKALLLIARGAKG